MPSQELSRVCYEHFTWTTRDFSVSLGPNDSVLGLALVSVDDALPDTPALIVQRDYVSLDSPASAAQPHVLSLIAVSEGEPIPVGAVYVGYLQRRLTSLRRFVFVLPDAPPETGQG